MTHSLKPWNTFGIDHCAKHIVCAENEQQLLSAWQQATREGLPVMILGEGSNVLFLENYAGTVILNRLKGIEVNETADAWHLHVGAGEKLASAGSLRAGQQHARPGESGAHPWLRWFLAYTEYWRVWRRTTARLRLR
ncbi:UDP-N-acetylenolpyruvoylglucosamine reductase [Salmonella enterica subsp. enterica]|uniref:UDP-N-acetylenolpyruvoylglucosamine reductase n=1 Tax=Salmonella enterica I TaxID=59201 RepID=A0A3S4IE57_SALET|nr:UDP-N-acetylenolpyruvoylglucosamine reductase [Salmonella enterica subsp. enterica]